MLSFSFDCDNLLAEGGDGIFSCFFYKEISDEQFFLGSGASFARCFRVRG